jgi:hypothetical protein
MPPAATFGRLDEKSANEHYDGRVYRLNMACGTNSDVK